jgi:beta-glucosidase
MNMTTQTQFPFQNPNLPIEARCDDLIARMTLQEKVSQMLYTAPGIARLNIPNYNWWNECQHGVARAGIATVFPQAIGMAATWNVDLMRAVAVAISDEARAKHHDAIRRGIRDRFFGLTYWTPNINIFRDPRWGRGQETCGEDPYLTARLAVAFIQGLQGDDPHYLKLVATVKHFAAHSGPEGVRHDFEARANERDLRETYLPAFQASVQEAQVHSVLGAYNRINGDPCCASPTLLGNILRGEWGFDGYVVSDCGAIDNIYKYHRAAKTAEQAAALAVKAGCDLNCGETYRALNNAVIEGLISEATIDQSVKRLFTARMRLGMFDPPEMVRYAQIPIEVNNCPAHQELALQMARESIVLLKNKRNFLPLSKELESIAVIGPNANNLQVLIGNYYGTPSHAITPLEGIRKKISSSTKLYFAQGCDLADGFPSLKVIPTSYLRPVDADANQTGLTGAYYDYASFEGSPALTRVDPSVDFTWKKDLPLGGKVREFAVRWTGYLVPPVTATYTLGVDGFTSYYLYLDGERIAEYEYSGIHTNFTKTKEIELEAGRFYRVRLDYVNLGPAPQVQLLWSLADRDYTAEAMEVAKKAHVIVMVMGISPILEGEEMPIKVEGFEGGDRTEIELPRPQEELLKRIHALGKPMVLVLMNGSAIAVNWANDNLPAIIEAWYPGEQGGTAIADVLFGDYNPGGRLPITFYKSVDQLPPFADYSMAGRTYRYMTAEPLFPFGHGLSYTAFEYSDLKIDPPQIAKDGQANIQLSVKNTGECTGDEVVQLYVRHIDSKVPRPVKELKGFMHITLQPGATKIVTFALAANQLAYYDQGFVVESGRVQVMLGSSSQDVRLMGEVVVE